MGCGASKKYKADADTPADAPISKADEAAVSEEPAPTDPPPAKSDANGDAAAKEDVPAEKDAPAEEASDRAEADAEAEAELEEKALTSAETEEVVKEVLADTVVANDEEYKGPAPHMHEYFKKMIAFNTELLSKGIDYAFELSTNEELMAAHKKSEEAHVAELKELIEKSFKLHDTKGKDDLLDPEEASLFFEHYAAESALMLEAMGSATMFAHMKGEMEADLKSGLWQYEGDDKEEYIEKKKAEKKEFMEAMKAGIEEVQKAYEENKAERHAEAFKLSDANGDGSLNLAEALAILLPGEEKNAEFMKALGFIPGE